MDEMKLIGSYGIVPVAVINNSDNAVPAADALSKGGLPLIEVTLRTEAACDSIRRIAGELPDVLVGAGTVLTTDQCKRAVDAGAKFIVSPCTNESVVGWCCENKIPVIPGAVSPTEIDAVLAHGLHVVKFFPASVYGGAAGCKALYDPYQSAGIGFIPTGGVNNDNIGDFIRKPFITAVGGSWMCKAADIDAGNFDAIQRNAKNAVSAMLGFSVAHVGVNFDAEQDARDAAGQLCRMFGFEGSEHSSSIFASQGIELCKSAGMGKNGHIAIHTNSVKRAVFYLEKNGFAIDRDHCKYNAAGAMTSAYLKDEIGGFAVHLLARP